MAVLQSSRAWRQRSARFGFLATRVTAMASALAAFAGGAAPVPGQQATGRHATADPVAREFRVRADAVALMSAGEAALSSVPLPDADADWTAWVAWLDTYRRAGVAPRLSGAAVPSHVPSVEALLLVLAGRSADPADPGEILRSVRVGLSSPFRAVREAALQRAAREIWRDVDVGPSVARWLRDGAEPSIDAPTRRTLARALLRSGVVFDRAGAIAGWGDLELFRALLAAPAGGAAAGAFDGEAASAGAAEFSACLTVLGHVQGGGGAVGDRDLDLDRAAALFLRAADESEALDAYDLDDATSAFLDALLSADPAAAAPLTIALNRRLIAGALDAAADERGRARCIRGAARLSRPRELLPAVRPVDEPTALELWNELDLRPGFEVGDALDPWIVDPREDVREAVVRAVGRRYLHESAVDFEPFVRRCLVDPLPTIRSLAFSWICDSGRAPSLDGPLFEAWLREGEAAPGAVPGGGLSERQRRWLAQLPRNAPMPAFRDVLVGLVASRALDDPSSIELLGSFAGDTELARTVTTALAAEVERIGSTPGYLERLVPDGRAAALATALFRIEGDAAVAALDAAIEGTMRRLHGDDALGDARPQLPKTAVALLARTDAGRRRLERYLGAAIPGRVRYEAALQLATRASQGARLDQPVARALIDGFERVDGSLRMRAIAALGGWRTPESAAFLVRLAEESGVDSERHASIEALAAQGLVAPLDGLVSACTGPVVPDLRAIEAAIQAGRQLGRLAGLAGPRAALRHLAALDGSPALDEERLVLRGALLESLAAGCAGRRALASGPTLDAAERQVIARALLRMPVMNARAELRQRFRGRKLAPAAFRYRSESEAFRAFVDAGAEDEVLAATPAWITIDGRCLLELGRRAEEGSATAVALLRASVVALQGERSGVDTPRRIAEARLLLVRSLTLAGDPRALEEADRMLAGLTVDTLRGQVRRGVLEVALGPRRTGSSLAPHARLAIAARFAELRSAVAADDPERTELAARRARPWARLDAASLDALESILR